MAVIAALAAALAYAVAAVFQQRAARDAPPSEALHLRLLWSLAHRPIWLIGVLADVAGFVLQFIALGRGALILVQPLLVSSLLFAMPLGAALSANRRITRQEWVAALEVVVGLALFLVVADPRPGSATTTATGWSVVTAGTAAPVVVLLSLSRYYGGSVRASLQAASAGVIYGLSAAYTKTVAHAVTGAPGAGHALVAVLTAWQSYALIATGVVGLVLAQTAFQAGPLGWSLPALTVVDPVVSIIIGAIGFQEAIASSPLAITAEVAGMALMALGVTGLARSSPMVPAPAQPTTAAGGPP
ncbi:MAG TPA: DMT family transporter [Acidimicrobiales bacterium]|nr:DMT family transporter [Acidimicrobiales bacterium]